MCYRVFAGETRETSEEVYASGEQNDAVKMALVLTMVPFTNTWVFQNETPVAGFTSRLATRAFLDSILLVGATSEVKNEDE